METTTSPKPAEVKSVEKEKAPPTKAEKRLLATIGCSLYEDGSWDIKFSEPQYASLTPRARNNLKRAIKTGYDFWRKQQSLTARMSDAKRA
jgi:hypothetical protein